MSRISGYRNYTVIQTAGTGYVRQTVGATSAALASIPAAANGCTIMIIGNVTSTAGQPCINYRLDGVAPTTTTGMPLFNGAILQLFPGELALFRAISADGNNQIIATEYATLS